MILKYKSYNTINEVNKLDYSAYNKPLTKDELVHLVKTECNEWDIKRIKLSRNIGETNLPDFILVDASKHELRYPEGRHHNYILHHIIDKSPYWKNFPNKYRSIFFWYSRKSAGIGQNYILIPYNNSVLASAPQMAGRKMDFVYKVLQLPTSTLCRKLEISYENIFKEKIDYSTPDTTIECIRKLNGALDTDAFLKTLKNAMMRYEKNDVIDFFNFIFGPKKNHFEIVNKEYCYHEHLSLDNANYGGENYQPGWTSSKVLLINKKIYDNIKNEIE
jgi:hypothetical protein